MNTAERVTDYGLQAVFYASLIWPGIVAAYWKWWHTAHHLGWTVVVKGWALSLALLPGMFGVWFGFHSQPAPLEWVTAAGVWLIIPILAWRAYAIWLVQHDGARSGPQRKDSQ